MTEGLNGIIARLERQKTAIEHALSALRDVEGIETPDPVPAAPPTRKSAVKNRRSQAQKKRWAAKKAAAAVVTPTKPAPRKGGMTEDGRRRLAEAMKRRWAVKRAGMAVKKAGRRKAA
jgi:hypothetical protein